MKDIIIPHKVEISGEVGISRSGRFVKQPSKFIDYELNDAHSKNLMPHKSTKSYKSSSNNIFHQSTNNIKKEKTEIDTKYEITYDAEYNVIDDREPLLIKMKRNAVKDEFNKKIKLKTKTGRKKCKDTPRYTAYMLWAKNVRKSLRSTYSNLSFSECSRMLADKWAKIPSNEKYNWRRRAKRLSKQVKANAQKI